MPDPIRAVLFDVDGTLLNTFEFIYQSFEHSLAKHGYAPISRNLISVTMGGPLRECYRSLVSGCDADAMAESHRLFQTDNLQLVQLFPATIEVLETLRQRGLKLGAVTTRSLRTSVRSMEITCIAKYFGVIVSAEDVANHKPHPEPLEKAMKVLDVKPEETIMVGDTLADIEAGKNAGTRTVAALYGFAGERLNNSGADFTITHLDEILKILSIGH